jgi:hypothetical protein
MRSLSLLAFVIATFSFQAHAKDWGIWIKSPDSEYKLKVGGRLQGSLLTSDAGDGNQDLYVRRARLNLDYRPDSKQSISIDIRNDKANEGDGGEREFALGDFFWQYKLNDNMKIKLFRGKVDVSYSQTCSSRNLVHIERTGPAEHAAGFINESRRASNAQLNGVVDNYLTYHLVVGDGVQSGDLEDLSGSSVSEIVNQRLMYGGKVRYYFFDDTKKKIQESFYGKGRSLSIGLGYFQQDNLKIKYGSSQKTLVRKLTNVEVRGVFGRFSFLAEYFRFDNDLINLGNDTFDTSAGYYAQAEYHFTADLKHAFYVRTESHDRYLASDDDYSVNATGIGYNHYIDEEALRWGIFAQTRPENETLSLEAETSINTYIAMNY